MNACAQNTHHLKPIQSCEDVARPSPPSRTSRNRYCPMICPICFEEMEEDKSAIVCVHKHTVCHGCFKPTCLERRAGGNCPTCRAPMYYVASHPYPSSLPRKRKRDASEPSPNKRRREMRDWNRRRRQVSALLRGKPRIDRIRSLMSWIRANPRPSSVEVSKCND